MSAGLLDHFNATCFLKRMRDDDGAAADDDEDVCSHCSGHRALTAHAVQNHARAAARAKV